MDKEKLTNEVIDRSMRGCSLIAVLVLKKQYPEIDAKELTEKLRTVENQAKIEMRKIIEEILK